METRAWIISAAQVQPPFRCALAAADSLDSHKIPSQHHAQNEAWLSEPIVWRDAMGSHVIPNQHQHHYRSAQKIPDTQIPSTITYTWPEFPDFAKTSFTSFLPTYAVPWVELPLIYLLSDAWAGHCPGKQQQQVRHHILVAPLCPTARPSPASHVPAGSCIPLALAQSPVLINTRFQKGNILLSPYFLL